MLEFQDTFIKIMSYDCENESDITNILSDSTELKENIIKFIKNKKYNIKNIVNFLKENVDDITLEELSNTKISFTYLNTFN